MSRSFQDLLAQMKAEVDEISVDELKNRLDRNDDLVVLDVREPDEHEAGLVPGAKPLPRGFLEPKIESLVPKKQQPIAVYCASGTRSTLGAASLKQIGYENVVNVAGGINAWMQAGYDLHRPRKLTESQRARYARQTILPQMGEEGQLALQDARVLVIGAGGLGSPTALYLASAGVGTLGIVDDDKADMSNLHRQVLHSEAHLDLPKVESARERLGHLNSDITIRTHPLRLDSSNVMEVFRDYDIVVDGTDNFPTRYLINDACVFLGIPNVHGSIFHFDGQVSIFNAPPEGGNGSGPSERGPCYRCLYPEPPPPELAPSCAEAGVLGAVCGVVGSLQAAETIKLIIGAGDALSGRILSIDLLRESVRELKTRRDPSCPVCGDRPTITEPIDYEAFCAAGL